MPVDDEPLRAAIECARRQDGALTRSQALALGLTSARIQNLRSAGHWRSPVRGGFVLPDADDPIRAVCRAAAMAMPDAVVCASSAGRLHQLAGLPSAPPDEPVHLVVPRGVTRERANGVALHWWTLMPEEIVDLGGIPVTTIARTVADLSLRSSREIGVSIVDSALNRRRIGPTDLPAIQLMMRGRPGIRRVERWWKLVDGRSESPLETRIRLILVDAGFTPEHLQYLVIDGGSPVARLDLAWPSRMLAVEADGALFHDEPEPLYRDRARQNALTSLGWRVVRLTWADALNPARVLQQVRPYLG